MTLKERMVQHANTGSIREHHTCVQNAGTRPNAGQILEHTVPVFHSNDKSELLLAEALLIKADRPTLNRQNEGNTRILKVF